MNQLPLYCIAFSSVHPKKKNLFRFSLSPFFVALPRDSNDAVWEHVRSKYSLSMEQLEALKNHVCFSADDFVPVADGSEANAAGAAAIIPPSSSSSSAPLMAPPMAASASVPASIAMAPAVAPPMMHLPAAVEEVELACNHCKKTFKSAGGLKYHLQNVILLQYTMLTMNHSTILTLHLSISITLLLCFLTLAMYLTISLPIFRYVQMPMPPPLLSILPHHSLHF